MKIQVINWDNHFENDRSRTRDKCSFVCVPNKQHGIGLATLLTEEDGAALYGIWCLLLGLLSRQKLPRNGYLTDTGQGDGRYLTVSELAVAWRRPKAEIERCFQLICSPNISWAIDLDKKSPSTPLRLPVDSPLTHLEGKGREGNEEKGKEPPTPPPAADAIYAAYPRHVARQAALLSIKRAIKRIPHPNPTQWLLDKTVAFAKSPKGRAGEYCPYPTTWFNQGRYDDDPAQWNDQTAPAKPEPPRDKNGNMLTHINEHGDKVGPLTQAEIESDQEIAHLYGPDGRLKRTGV